jgi:hypothetical protein
MENVEGEWMDGKSFGDVPLNFAVRPISQPADFLLILKSDLSIGGF